MTFASAAPYFLNTPFPLSNALAFFFESNNKGIWFVENKPCTRLKVLARAARALASGNSLLITSISIFE